MKKRSAKKGLLRRGLPFFVAVVALAVVAFYFAITSWIEKYLRSDAFRKAVAAQIGMAAHAQCTLEQVNWSGWNAFSAGASLIPEDAAFWKQLEADGLQASFDWAGVKRGVWSIPVVTLDSLRLSLAGPQKPEQPASAPDPASAGQPAETVRPEAPSWVSRWLPKKTEIDEVDVHRFDLKPDPVAGGVAIRALHLKARPATDEGAWIINGNDGELSITGMSAPFQIGRISSRVDTRAFTINDASARWTGGSEVTLRGAIPFSKDQPWSFSGRIAGLDLRHVLSDDWKTRISGVLEGDYELHLSPGSALLSKGKMQVKDGVVQGLPVLDRVADFTRTARFRHVVLDEARADVEIQGTRRRISNLVLQSNGLVRVEGELLIEQSKINGNLLVGVSPETLRWLPGAQNHVFTETNGGKTAGFVWTHVQVSGTVDSPKEDLSNRLLAAMGKAVLIDLPMDVLESSAGVVGKNGGAILDSGKAVLDTGKNVIKDAGDAAGKGLDVLKDFVPLFPK